jgi:hypothetical protein
MKTFSALLAFSLFALAAIGNGGQSPPDLDWSSRKLLTMQKTGQFYFGGFFSTYNGFMDEYSQSNYDGFASAVGKGPSVVGFDWASWRGTWAFPCSTASRIIANGSTPYVNLLMQSSPWPYKEPLKPNGHYCDSLFTLDDIIQGRWDDSLRCWALGAKNFRHTILLQWGCECNGTSFWWCPYNTEDTNRVAYGDPAKFVGPEKFRYAFRHIVSVFRGVGATNVKFVFHVAGADNEWALPGPIVNGKQTWLRHWSDMRDMYPGDAYVDLIGWSKYDYPADIYPWTESFARLDSCYRQCARLSAVRPLAFLELGFNYAPHQGDIRNAVRWEDSIFVWRDRHPRVALVVHWNSIGGDSTTPNAWWVDLRVQDDPLLSKVWRAHVGFNSKALPGTSGRK